MGPDGAAVRPDSGEQAIVAAFAAARERGKPDWSEMSIAVLKNRILDVTNRKFREADYGVESFGHFLDLYPEVVEVDVGRRPPRVRLRGIRPSDASATSPSERALGRGRWTIRPDLWKAVVDYESGARYVWADGRAVGADPADSSSVGAHAALPTIDSEQLHQWRTEFVQSLPAPVREAFESELHQWREVTHATGALPTQLRGQWTAFFKSQVRARLEEWFKVTGIDSPPDLVNQATAPRHADAKSSLEQMRRLVIGYIGQMTEDELLALHLPVSLLNRVDRSDG